jgi:iron complex outermembrane receptor protein
VVLFASGGNPYLRPYFSNNFRFSAEKYFAAGRAWSAWAFWKQISNFVDPNNSYAPIFRLSGHDRRPRQQLNYTTQGYVTAPANTGRGWAEGVEMQATVPLKIWRASGRLWRARQRGLSRSSIRYANGSR